MSYTPTQWQTGDTITAEKLNKMEQGITAASSGGDSKIAIFNMYSYEDPIEETTQYVVYVTKEQMTQAALDGKVCYARMAGGRGVRYGFNDCQIIGFYDNTESLDGSFVVTLLMYREEYSAFDRTYLSGNNTHIYPSTNGEYIPG